MVSNPGKLVDAGVGSTPPRVLVSGEFDGLALLDRMVFDVAPELFAASSPGWHCFAPGHLGTEAIESVLGKGDVILSRQGVEFLRGGVARVRHDQGVTGEGPSVAASARLAMAGCWAACGAWRTHAAVVEYRGLGFLLTGASGFGKSTAALSALAAGARVVSDDEVLIWIDGDRPVATRVRPWLMARSTTHAAFGGRFGELGFRSNPSGEEHRAWIPSDDDRFPGSVPLACWASLEAVAESQRPPRCIVAAPGANPLAELMVASAPLFLTPPFDQERKAMLQAASVLARRAQRFSLTTGHDLIDSPVAAWEWLFERVVHDADTSAAFSAAGIA